MADIDKLDKSRSRSLDTPTNSSDESIPKLTTEMVELLQRRLVPSRNPDQIQRNDGSDTTSPLYLVHPGAGICLHYNRVRPLGRDVHTIQDARLLADAKDDWDSVHEFAHEYSSMIAQRESEGQEIILGGWSFGGIVAFEMARLLESTSNIKVLGVVLIDAPPPIGHQPIAKATIEAAMAATQKRSNAATKAKAFEDAVATLTIRNNLRRATLLGKYKPERRGKMPQIILLRSSEGVDLGVSGLPENKWLHDRGDVSTCSAAWEELTGKKASVLHIPGDHFTPFEASNIGGTSDAIREACHMIEDT